MTHGYLAKGMLHAVLLAVMLAGAVHLAAQNGSQFRDWKSDVLANAPILKPQAACAALISLTGYEFSILSATDVPAEADAPQSCRVNGQILPEVGFEVNLPAAWNGRLYMFGNGGYAGEALGARGRVATVRRALARGFAVAQTNTGHDATTEPLGTFAASPQKLVDYTFRAVHVTAMTARKLVQAYYGTAPRHAYFDGCSTGGRQGLISAQRFPEDFDGILVGAPVLDFTKTMINYVTIQRAMTTGPILPEKLKPLADAVYRKCDGIDGLADGLIDDPRRCVFTPSKDLPICTGGSDAPGCFTAAQIATLEVIYGGTKRNGAAFFPGQPVGAEVAAPGGPMGPMSGWIPWTVPPPGQNPLAAALGGQSTISAAFGETFFRYMAFGRPDPKYDWLSFNVNADLDKLQRIHALLDATDPDLTRFKARGGKILSYFGWADPALNPLMGVNYYESVVERMGPGTTDFFRLFMVPGMFHCTGGVGVSTFDAMTPLVAWVEKGTPPATVVGSRILDGKVVRSRPLCPYPQVARYGGSRSTDEAANFKCVAPASARTGGPGPSF